VSASSADVICRPTRLTSWSTARIVVDGVPREDHRRFPESFDGESAMPAASRSLRLR
jgi:hypothetical protein